MLFRLELEHPIVRNKNASLLYGIPATILQSKGHISVLWTQLIGKKQWSVTFHWLEEKSMFQFNKSIDDIIHSMEAIPGVVKFSIVPYEGEDFVKIYKEYMESGLYTREEFDNKMEELLGCYVDEA
jgi:hypothetical protein